MVFNRATVNLATGDGLALFSKSHPYMAKKVKGTQSNRFWGTIDSAAAFEEYLNLSANALRNFKDENGDVLGYVADTIVLPGNAPKLEQWAKSVCGSERVAGSSNNDINTQYGNWSIAVIPEWQLQEGDSSRFMIMSSDANKQLAGNMFFNRIPLSIKSWIDNHTGNYIWNGRCRFGVGFGSWKHMALVSAASDSDGTELK